MQAGLRPHEWTCGEGSPGLPAAQKGSWTLASKHTRLQAGASMDSLWEGLLGRETLWEPGSRPGRFRQPVSSPLFAEGSDLCPPLFSLTTVINLFSL